MASPVVGFNGLTRHRLRGLHASSSAAKLIAYRAFLSNIHFIFTGKAMADAANKYAENVPGKFYVDDQCIDCDLCRETAPANFKRNDDGGHSYVYKQPESPEEEGLCKEAMEGCPVEAIGNDGDGA
jgi:ferredoxin